MLRQRGWLGGWLSVTRRYCIKTAKPILKLFRPSGSPIILSSSNHAPIPNCKGNPFSGAVNTQGVGKISDFRAIFDANRRLSSITVCAVAHHCYNGDVSFLWEKWKLWPPVKSKPLNRLTQNLSGLITSTSWTFVTNLVKIRSRGTSGQRGEI